MSEKTAKKKRKKRKRTAKQIAALCEKYDISREFYDCLMGIPGYDPFRDAGDCHLSEKAACKAIGFFHTKLRFIEGVRGKPFFRLEPWQQAIVANLWGWRRPDWTRRYRRAFIYVPKKNGKTPFAAGLVLLVLHTDNEPSAKLYSLSYVKDQATYIFDHAKKMIRECEDLQYLRIFGGSGGGQQRSIHDEETGSFYRPLVADEDSADGANVHMAVLDEVHRFKKRGIADVIEGGTITRQQPLIIYTTTADSDRPSLCNEKLDYAKKVRDGVLTDATFLPVVYETSQTANWKSPKVWAKANPNLGVSISEESFREIFKQAVASGETDKFRRLHLNVKTQVQRAWLPMDKWDACPGPGVDAPGPEQWRARMLEELTGAECYGGIDLSSKIALTALVLLFPKKAEAVEGQEPETGYVLIPWFWLPRETAVKDEQKYSIPYSSWAQRGFIELTEGDVIDHRLIRRRVNELGKAHRLQEIGFDPWNATEMAVDLGPDNDGFQMFVVRQGYPSLSEPSKKFEALIRSGRIEHGGNPVLRWMASSVQIAADLNSNIRPVKPKPHSPHKIDGISATVTAFARAMIAPGPSVYETRGILSV